MATVVENNRADLLTKVLGEDRAAPIVKQLETSKGDLSVALTAAGKDVHPTDAKRAQLADTVASLTGNDIELATKLLAKDPNATTLQEVVLASGLPVLTEYFDTIASKPSLATSAVLKQPDGGESGAPKTSVDEIAAEQQAAAVRQRFFEVEPSAVLHRMIIDKEIHAPDGTTQFFTNKPDFNIRSQSVLAALNDPKALDGVPAEQREPVVQSLKQLQTAQALTKSPDAIPQLQNSNLTNAFQVSSIPRDAFVSAFKGTLGEGAASQIHQRAMQTRTRNDHTLVSMLQTVRGTGIAALDGKQTMAERKEILSSKLNAAIVDGAPDPKAPPVINLEALFGSLDHCECDDCQSVISPAAYFVELLQFLRNNNLDADTKNWPNSGKDGIGGTVLEKLFARRPDLGCLELSCENTNTILPYIDLSNEVMESFVVHRLSYAIDTHQPKWAIIDVYNTEDEPSSELLSEPQHTNYDAYCVLKDAVFPILQAPYHQPLDETRIFLSYLGTSRYELMKAFKEQYATRSGMSANENRELKHQHNVTLQRAATAEFWSMTPVDYIAITRQSYWTKKFWEIIKHEQTISSDEYETNIGRQQPWQYWGYDTDAAMQDTSAGSKGLTFVKAQFLPRSGISYADLVNLLQSKYINPTYPSGRDLQVLQSVKFSYRYLQHLVNPNAANDVGKYGKLAKFLYDWKPWARKQGIRGQDMPECGWDVTWNEICCWLKNWWAPVGKLIVLESNDVPMLPIQGYLAALTRRDGGVSRVAASASGENLANGDVAELHPANLQATHSPIEKIGWLNGNGTLVDGDTLIGSVLPDGSVISTDGIPFLAAHTEYLILYVLDSSIDRLKSLSNTQPNQILAMVNSDSKLVWPTFADTKPKVVEYLPTTETCNIDHVTLVHLDSSPLSDSEWDRMQIFIRLYNKLGWSINDTDQALSGLAKPPKPEAPSVGGVDTIDDITDWSQIRDPPCQSCGQRRNNCHCGGESRSWCADGCTSTGPEPPLEVSAEVLEQLIAVRSLQNLTGVPLSQLLTLWADIPTRGNPSLYSSLFLSHTIAAIDPVFKSDSNGNFLPAPYSPISNHMPVILAALKLNAAGLSAIVDLEEPLNIKTLSRVYRHVLLGQMLGVQVSQLPQAIALFGPAFTNASVSLNFVQLWNKMQATGFSFAQLNYVILGDNDPLRPIGPSKTSVIKTTKTIFDGLNSIATQNPDYTVADEASITAELVTAKVSQVFDSVTTASIVGLLNGTTLHTTNAPTGLHIDVPKALQQYLTYVDDPSSTPPRATLSVTGILTKGEEQAALNLASGNEDWAAALKRVAKQADDFFNAYLTAIFSNKTEAKKHLLAGDVAASPTSTPPTKGTAPEKMIYFMQGFIVYLRSVLSQQLITSTVASAANISSPDMADLLLNNIIFIGAQSAMQILSRIHVPPPAQGASWSGYLIPPTTTSFIFYANGGFTAEPPALSINGGQVPFAHQQADPNDVWFSDPFPLVAGRLYTFTVTGQSIDNLQWTSTGSTLSSIPSSALLPDYANNQVLVVFQMAYKIGLLTSTFGLSVDEVAYISANKNDFAGTDFNAVTLPAWIRLANYTTLRNSMPAMPNTLLGLFKFARNKPSIPKLVDFIVSVTNWANDDVSKLITPDHLDLQDPSLFVNEIPMEALQKCISVKTTVGVDVNLLFKWADPTSFLWERARTVADNVRNQVRSRYDVATWEKLAQPLFNKLRSNQRDALIAFLLVQQPLRDWGVVDADSLFEFFLIDVQMGDCLQTSRIKQAISTVQVYVERCLMNLEVSQGVASHQIDRSRWEGFMKGYSFWAADREVFLWPENWLDPSIRDDKSNLYLSLESKILQKNFNMQNAQDAMKGYLFSTDQVANLEVIGLVEDDKAGDTHIFAKTRAAPWVYFYRRFHNPDKTWSPWESLGVDILSYDNTSSTTGALIRSGSYLLPVVWNSRLLIFLPEFSKKQPPQQSSGNMIDMGNQPVSTAVPASYWEIKMGFSEYRNGMWTTKQVTSQAIAQQPAPSPQPPVNSYQFVPKLTDPKDIYTTIEIGVFNNSTAAFGSFVFDGGQVLVRNTTSASFTLSQAVTNADFMYQNANSDLANTGVDPGDRTLYSYHSDNNNPVSLFHNVASVTYPGTNPQQPTFTPSDSSSQTFYDEFSHKLLARATTAPDISDVFNFFESIRDADKKAEAFGNATPPFGWSSDFNELETAYALYHWELGCYAPMTMMNKFLATQQFDEALAMASYVFDPFAKRSMPAHPGDLWRWPPFKNVLPEDALEQLFAQLKPKVKSPKGSAIQEWRDHPFEPFAVARSRRQAFMKWFAIQYINILIAYGDWYFMQNTLESLPLALQLYVRASHIYGPAAEQIPRRGKKLVQTYNSLLNSWDGFSNAVVQLELAFPYSSQIDEPDGRLYNDKLLANIYGFATTRYFCVPSNQQLLAVRSLIDDRLYKIRHCQNIYGVVEKLPLFEPPINPALLIDATAAGVSLDAVLNDIDSPMPNYKFLFLLQKALELCTDLKALGAQFLSGKEKIDSETLQVIRAQQEVTMSNLVMQLKTQALSDANLAVAALQQQRIAVAYRMTHYLNLLGESTGAVPAATSDFQPLAEQIEVPSTSNNPLRLMSYETSEVSKASDAQNTNSLVGGIEAMAQYLRIIPNADINVEPWGVGTSVRFGPENFANAASTVARIMKISADDLSYQSTNAGRSASFTRQLQDRIHQANIAGYELKTLDAQIQTQTAKVTMANQEIVNQQQAIDNSNQIQQYLANKYTNVDLYTWMDNNVQTLFYQTYTVAFQIARKAQAAFCFERGLDPSQASYISFGYWNQNRDGLLAGENLYLGLKQLEAAYQSDRGYDYEITRHVSLRQLNPVALFQLREQGFCQVDLPEILFDMDFPGHYMRRIKSVSLSIPCVVGPYTSISCTLRLLSSQYRVSPTVTDVNSYLQGSNAAPDLYRTATALPIGSIAVSTAQNDPGVFELNFKDERYVPFEGGGVISSWSLELPSGFRQWDYSTMSDVVMHVKYTAKAGGDNLSGVASNAVKAFVKSAQNLSQDQGLFALFDLRSEFANEWARANTAPMSSGSVATLMMNDLAQRLPAYTRSLDPNKPTKITAVDITLLLSPNPSWVSQATIGPDGAPVTLALVPNSGQLTMWQSLGAMIPMSNWQIQLSGSSAGTLTKGFVIVRYQLA